MKTTITRYRQGDVLISTIETLPEGRQSTRESGVVAYGEATGHAHRVCVEDGAEVLEIEIQPRNLNSRADHGLFVRVTAAAGVAIVHEEHRALHLPPGDYRVTRQWEYTPEDTRHVRD